MKILIDTNIVLDLMLRRDPFYDTAAAVLGLSKKNNVQEYISASAVTDIYYISYRQLRDKRIVMNLLKELLTVVSVAGVSKNEILRALELDWNDFEDSVQYSVALLQGMDCMITRNLHDYEKSEIPVFLPEQALQIII